MSDYKLVPDVATQILSLISDECRYWQGRDEARRGGYAILYAKAKELISNRQPAPDVAALVEALTELCDEIDNHEIHTTISKTNILWFKRKARSALATHRKQGGE